MPPAAYDPGGNRMLFDVLVYHDFSITATGHVLRSEAAVESPPALY